MFTNFKCFVTKTPDLSELRCIYGGVNIDEKRDKSVRSLFHWKVLKCRMLIFSAPQIIASPDIRSDNQIVIVYPGSLYSNAMILQLLQKFGIEVTGTETLTSSTIELCLSYTLRAKIAPLWNLIGSKLLVRGRNFLMGKEPLDAISVAIFVNESMITIQMSPRKVRFPLDNALKERMSGRTMVTVLPSLNSAEMISFGDSIPTSCPYKNYREIQRHWKNVHGYRLPEDDSGYVEVLFWTGPPLTYPQICIKSQQPIVTPALPQNSEQIINNFLRDLQVKMPAVLNTTLKYQLLSKMEQEVNPKTVCKPSNTQTQEIYSTQNISLCTPTQDVSVKINEMHACTKNYAAVNKVQSNPKLPFMKSNILPNNRLNKFMNPPIKENTLKATECMKAYSINTNEGKITPIFHPVKSQMNGNENCTEKVFPIFRSLNAEVQEAENCVKSNLATNQKKKSMEENSLKNVEGIKQTFKKINTIEEKNILINVVEELKIVPNFKKVKANTSFNNITTSKKIHMPNKKVIKAVTPTMTFFHKKNDSSLKLTCVKETNKLTKDQKKTTKEKNKILRKKK